MGGVHPKIRWYSERNTEILRFAQNDLMRDMEME